jgi:hypothetical protein
MPAGLSTRQVPQAVPSYEWDEKISWYQSISALLQALQKAFG